MDRKVLADLVTVVLRASEIWAPSVIPDWLDGPNGYLGARPIDVILAGRVDEVLDALDTAASGAIG